MGDRFAIVSTTPGSVATATGLSVVTAASESAACDAINAVSGPVQIQTGDDLVWTLVNGSIAGGSATEIAGAVTLTHDANLTSGWYFGTYTGPSARATFNPRRWTNWRIQARLSGSGGTNVGSRCGFGLYTDATTNRLIHVAPTSTIFNSYNSGSGNYNPVLAAASNVGTIDGTQWVRITRENAFLFYEFGFGVGVAEPTEWSPLWTETVTTIAPTGGGITLDAGGDWSGIGVTMVCEFWQPLDAPVVAPVITWDSITVWDL